MADKKPDIDEVVDNIEEKELPSPRFNLVNTMFDEVDGMLAKYDESDHLTIFEMEILLMMLRKKVDHIGIMAALQPREPEHKEADPNMYK
jgi:hypothetical protein